MGEAIGEVIGFGVGIAISPFPVVAVILMLFSERAHSNSVAFMVAWILGIATVATVVSLVPSLESDRGDPTDTAGWIELVLGLLLLVGAVRQWRRRPHPGEQPPIPGWMHRVDTLHAGAAFGLGLLLSALNPKNLLLAAAAGAAIAASDLTTGEHISVIVAFTAIAAITVVGPVLANLVVGARLAPRLDRAKDWLIGHNAAVLSVLFAVFGANLIGDAIQILAG